MCAIKREGRAKPESPDSTENPLSFCTKSLGIQGSAPHPETPAEDPSVLPPAPVFWVRRAACPHSPFPSKSGRKQPLDLGAVSLKPWGQHSKSKVGQKQTPFTPFQDPEVDSRIEEPRN